MLHAGFPIKYLSKRLMLISSRVVAVVLCQADPTRGTHPATVCGIVVQIRPGWCRCRQASRSVLDPLSSPKPKSLHNFVTELHETPNVLDTFADPDSFGGNSSVESRRSGAAGWQRLAADAQVSDPDAIVWRGDHTLPLEHQGLLVLGTPLGSPQFVDRELRKGASQQQVLLDRTPHVSDCRAFGYCSCSAHLHDPIASCGCCTPVQLVSSPFSMMTASRGVSSSSCTRQSPETGGASQAIGDGRPGFEERTQRPTRFLLVELG